jgi:ribosomal protein L3 glutamine methyltransferase
MPVSPSRVTAGEWITAAARRLRRARTFFGHGTTTAEEEALWILAHVSKLLPQRMLAALDRPAAPAHRRRAEDLITARIRSRKPAAYLLNEAWLEGMRFHVDERVIVPRSFIAELLREGLEPWLPPKIQSVLDMCTGSGCLAILAAKRFSGAAVDAVDLSEDALAVATINLKRHRLGKRIRLGRSDLFEQLPAQTYDLILSNPPYVDARAMRALPTEYRHEPAMALAGGKDGLDLVRKIIAAAPRYLSPQGILVVEIGHNREALEHACPRTAFTWLETSAGDGFVFLLARPQVLEAARALSGKKQR